jgi:hypothetical protein
MKHENGTRIRYLPNHHCLESWLPSKDDPEEDHTGTVIYFTTDGFYRVKWDDPNPHPDFFDSHRVFKPEQIEPLRRCVEAKAVIVVHPNDGESDEEALYRYSAEVNLLDCFEIVDTWEEPL